MSIAHTPGPTLPIEDVLPPLIDALRMAGRAVLEAPPGAGKTTRVPLALLEANLTQGRILMLEPRRLAARAAAQRMADILGEPVGHTVGYRMRGDTKVSKNTRIEVITEGILTRLLQSDQTLEGIGALIFDEFHERSLQSDLGLALAWDVRKILRDDLHILVMSATLDGAGVARLLDEAPRITSEGKTFPVETHWLARPHTGRLEDGVAGLVETALATDPTGLLVFLPGAREIHACARAIQSRCGIAAQKLYGALPFAEQRAVLRPGTGQKLVLATAIAETSLTIDGISVVIDAGLARRARYDPGSGMSRLVTEPVSRAEADQRRGRAGRLGPGQCYRLWTKGEEGALPLFPPPEIALTDLSGLALDLARWGSHPADLAFLDPPPEGALSSAKALLHDLGALDETGRLTEHGHALARQPVHPRLAHMLTRAGKRAAPLAALLSARQPSAPGGSVDLKPLLTALPHDPSLSALRGEAKRLARGVPDQPTLLPAAQAALAYPDRIAQRRPGEAPRYLLSGGKGAFLEATDPLSGAAYLIATELDGNPREARIRQALEIDEGTLRSTFAEDITTEERCTWSTRDQRIKAERQERLGALILRAWPWTDAPPEARRAAAEDGVRALGLDALNWTPSATRLRARIALFADDPSFPDVSDAGLRASFSQWLTPYLDGVKTAADLATVTPEPGLLSLLDWPARARLDQEAPAHFTTPLGRKIPIEYTDAGPEISLRLQEMLGQMVHPTVGPTRRPLRVTLLSPAGRPLQTTTDLPGFWSGSYPDVRKQMRGRYPKHHWPEDPREAAPTLRAKPRR